MSAESSVETAYRWLSARKVVKANPDSTLQAALRKACRRWFAQPNVCGIGVGLKTVQGTPTPVPALCVYVRKKKTKVAALHSIPPVVYLPPDQRPVLIDVVELAPVRASCRPGNGLRNAHATAKAGAAAIYLEKVNDPGSCYLLGCAHVLAPAGTNIGDRVECQHGGWTAVGKLTARYAKLTPGSHSSEPDHALVSVAPPAATNLKPVGSANPIAAQARSGVVTGETLRIHGRMKPAPQSVTVDAETMMVDVEYPGPPAFVVRFSDLIATTNGSSAGDSGAPVLDLQQRVVGYVVADNAGQSFIQPIAPLLASKFMRLYGVGGQAFEHALLAAGNQPGATLSVAGAIDTVARTLWGEARGGRKKGRVAIAWVIRHRASDAQARFPRTLDEVCRQPKPFSCWSAGNPNRPKLLAVTDADPIFAECLDIAAAAVNGSLPADPTGGANHYHAAGLNPLPAWANGAVPVATLDGHVFYRL